MQALPPDRRRRPKPGRAGPQRRRRPAGGSYPGFRYSGANKNSGLVWDAPTLQLCLNNPQAKVPGTRMAFPGLLSDAEIADVIAYLAQFCADGAKR
jgi:cytochrome c